MEKLGNRYDVLAVLGEGGMGQVLRVHDVVTERQVAMKLLRQGVAAAGLFQQEFWTMTRLRHPRTVEVYDYGTLPDGRPYFTMELVEGEALGDLIPMPPDALTRTIGQICEALAYIHAQGLVHGDLKPANIRLTPQGEVKLIDYGLMERSGQTIGSIRGTPHYLAPEAIRGGPIDRRADLYALGAMAYHLLTGRPPFDGESLVEILKKHLNEAPPPASLHGTFPAQLEEVLLKLLHKDPLSRFQSAHEVAAALGWESEPTTAGAALLAPVFVGRGQELAQLSEIFNAPSGAGVVVSGEAGIGKSRLLAEFRVQVQLAERPSALAVCGEQAELPYAPWISVLRQVLPSARFCAPAQVEAAAPVLATLLPELAGQGVATDPASPVPVLDPREDALRLAAAVSEILYAVADSKALVVFFEDLHAMDEASSELLGYVLRGARDHCLMVVGTSRQVGPPFATQVQELQLGPLPVDDVSHMVASILGGPFVPRPLVETVARLAAGNPLQVEGLLRHLVEAGMLQPEGDRWVPVGELDPADLPSALKDLVAARLERVSPGGRHLAAAIAVAARKTPIDLLAQVWDGDAESLFKALAELQAEGLVVGVSGDFDLAQPTTREIVYSSLSDPDRQALHGRIARALETRLDAADPDRPLVLAHHHLASSAPESALPYALSAVERAYELHAHSQVRHLASAALALPPGTLKKGPPASEDASRVRTLLLLGDAQRLLGETEKALASFDEAAAIAARLDLVEPAARAHVGAGRALQIRGELGRASERLRQGLDLVGLDGDPALVCRALCQLGRISYFSSDLETSVAHYEAALAVARRHKNSAAVAEAMAFMGFAYVSGQPQRLDQGLGLLRESLAIREEIGDRLGLLDTHMLLGNAYLAQGHFPWAADCFVKAQRLAYLVGHKDEEVFANLNLAIVALERGDFASCDDYARQGEAGSCLTNNRYASAMASALRAMAHLYLGRLSDALALITAAREQASQIEHRYLETVLGTYEAEFWLMLGRVPDARRCAQQALDQAEKSGSADLVPPLLILLGAIDARQGDRARARKHLDRAMELSGGAKGALARAERALAQCLLDSDDPRGALEHAQAGLALADEIGARPLVGECSVLVGQASAALGRGAQALAAYGEAQRIAEQIGAPELVARVHLGLAQTEPTRAAVHTQTAREHLDRLAASLPEAYRASFRERWGGDLLEPDKGAQGPTLEHRVSKLQRDWSALSVDVLRQQRELAAYRASAARLEQLILFSLSVGQLTDLRAVLDQAIDLVLEITGGERGFVLLFEEGVLSCQAYRNLYPEGKTALEFQISRSIAEEVLKTARPVCIVDALDDDRFKHQESIMVLQLRTVICVPLCIRGVVVGVIYVDRQTINDQFTETDLDLVLSLAALASNAVESANLHAAWAETSRKVSMLSDLGRMLASAVALEDALSLVLTVALEASEASRGYVMVLDGDRLQTRAGLDRIGQALGDPGPIPAVEQVVETGQRVLEGGAAVPLVAKAMLLGVMYLEAPSPREGLLSADLPVLDAIACHAALAIENSHLYRQVARRLSPS